MTDFRVLQARRKGQEDDQIAMMCITENQDRFWAKVHPEPNTGCWLWSGAVGLSGHGQFYLPQPVKHLTAAHRISWMMHYGDLSATQLVCHRCDNPYCVNPEHLFLGSHQDNSRDCRAKGRLKMPTVQGQNNAQSLLTDNDVLAIRFSRKSCAELSDEYGVARSTIHAIVTRATWTHLPGGRKAKSQRLKEYDFLNPELIREIEAHPLLSRTQVAQKFGVKETTVRHIRHLLKRRHHAGQ